MADLEGLATSHGQDLYAFAFFLCRDHHVAQDAVQNAFLKLADAGERNIEHPLPYLRRVISNSLTSNHRRKLLFDRTAPRLRDSRGENDLSEQVVARISVLDALGQTSRRQRTAIVLRYFEDLDDREISQVIGCAPATVRSLIKRGLKRMRVELEGLE